MVTHIKKANITPRRIPINITGNAAGSWIFQKMSNFPRPEALPTLTRTGSIFLAPEIVLLSIGH